VLVALIAYYPAATITSSGAIATLQRLLSVLVAGLMIVCATLSKETGITGLVLMAGNMSECCIVCYSMLHGMLHRMLPRLLFNHLSRITMDIEVTLE